jgi:hypothetical protein
MKLHSIHAMRFLAVLATLAAPAAHAQGMFEPLAHDDPAAVVGRAVTEALLAGDRARVDAQLRLHMDDDIRASATFATQLEAVLEALSRPGLSIQAFARGHGNVLVRLTAGAAATESLWLAVHLDPQAPDRIIGLGLPRIMMGPPPGAPAPADAPPPSERINATAARQLVDSLAVLLERIYPAPDTGRIIAQHIRGERARGAFSTADTPTAFAEAVTLALRAVNGDRHLGLRAPGATGPTPGMPDANVERRANYYLGQAEVLDGNVGYLRVGPLLSGSPAGLDRLGMALGFLQDTDALIIDLRGARGGSGAMSNAIVSHFMAADVPTLRTSSRLTGTTFVERTLLRVPGPRRLDVPLYVLVDAGSASAAEAVPFVLQNNGRATIVGERTAGAGRNVTFVPLPFGFVAGISHSRVQDPDTGREWEISGIVPDLQTTAEQALDAALAHARARVGWPR